MAPADEPHEKFGDKWIHACLMAAAAIGLGAAIQVRDGLYNPRAFLVLTIALASSLEIYLLPRIPSIEVTGEKLARRVLGVGIAFNFFQFFTYQAPGSDYAFQQGWLRATPFYYLLLALAALTSIGIVLRPRAARLLLFVLVIIFCVLGAWVLRRVPQPYMDVWPAQMEGIKNFVHH